MMTAFFISLAAFTLLYVALLWHRYRLEQLREQVEALKEEVGY